jgi:methylglutaconyl-CoA hydratase
VIEETVKRLADTWEGAEAKAGIDAFLSKSKAPWA